MVKTIKIFKLLTAGIARHTAIAHIPNINFTALDNFDIVCDKNGLHIAIYLKEKKAMKF